MHREVEIVTTENDRVAGSIVGVDSHKGIVKSIIVQNSKKLNLSIFPAGCIATIKKMPTVIECDWYDLNDTRICEIDSSPCKYGYNGSACPKVVPVDFVFTSG